MLTKPLQEKVIIILPCNFVDREDRTMNNRCEVLMTITRKVDIVQCTRITCRKTPTCSALTLFLVPKRSPTLHYPELSNTQLVYLDLQGVSQVLSFT